MHNFSLSLHFRFQMVAGALDTPMLASRTMVHPRGVGDPPRQLDITPTVTCRA